MSNRFASSTILAALALVIVAVTAILFINMPDPVMTAPVDEIEDYYIPADEEPPVVDATVEEQRTA